LALAVLAGLGQAVVGVMIAVNERNPGAYAGGALVSAAGLVVLVGVGLRRRSRLVGDLLIGLGVLPLLPFWWLVAPTLLALVVLVAAAIDAAEARSLGRSAAPASAWDRVAVVGLALAVAAAAAFAIIGGGPLALAGLAAAIIIGGAIALLARPGRSRPAA
jgi:hypothetical protein